MESLICFHCSHVFDKNNLKKESRRDISKTHGLGEVDSITVLATCYKLTEPEFRSFVDNHDDRFLCIKCFNAIKSISTSIKRCQSLTGILKASASTSFTKLLDTAKNYEDYEQNEWVQDEAVRDMVGKKRSRDCLTPVKSGCTPKGKKKAISTPKSNRRRLLYQTPSDEQPSISPKSPGPKVKVQIGFRNTNRKTILKGHNILACRAIVMKQYKTAINHLMEIETVQKDVADTLKKSIIREINSICKFKDFVLRLNNLSSFSWKLAYRQFQELCPVTFDIMKTIAGGKKVNIPRVITSLSVLLFTRNQSLSTVQAINSVFMFRGHVRTRVYSTFNRAGLCKSYKSTISSVDKICENFDVSVKKWAEDISEGKKDALQKSTPLDDHSYPVLHSDIVNQSTSVQIPATQAVLAPIEVDDHSYPVLHSDIVNQSTSVQIPATQAVLAPIEVDDHSYPVLHSDIVNQSTSVQIPATQAVLAPIEVDDHSYPVLHSDIVNQSTSVQIPATQAVLAPIEVDDHSYPVLHSDIVNQSTSVQIPATKAVLAPIEDDHSYPVLHSDIVNQSTSVQIPATQAVLAPIAEECMQPQESNRTPQASDGTTSPLPSFQIVMDNLNINQKCRHKTSDNKNKVHNLTHSIAVKDRIASAGLDEVYPQADILSVPDEAFIPSVGDNQALYNDFTHLIQRTLVEFMPFFHDCKDVVQNHIEHEYSEQSAIKSNVIPLGILEKDENITEQMIDIIEHLQQYVPKVDGKMVPILLGGDALSVERGDSAQRARQDAFTAEDRLDGFVWKSEDWHGHVISLQDTFNRHFKGTSSGERGTLFQLKNYFDRRGVKAEVKDAVNDCREFLRFVTKGLIVIAAMKELKFSSISEELPNPNEFTSEQKKEILDRISNDIVIHHVETEHFSLEHNSESQHLNNNRFPCNYQGCLKTFATNGKCLEKHMKICTFKESQFLNQPVLEEENEQVKDTKTSQSEDDFKYNYTCSLLREGLMDWSREDAAKENDGNRLLRLWRFDMLRFSSSNHTKYRLLAFKLQAQLMALLPPKLAHQLLHNRCVNFHGGKGCNVPGDLALEIMNMRAKDALTSLHGNLSSASIQRCGRSLQGCNKILDAYTEGLDQYFGKPSNSKPSIKKDINKFVEHLTEEELFKSISGRNHRSFPDFEINPLKNLNGLKLRNWLHSKKEDYSKIQRMKSYYV